MDCPFKADIAVYSYCEEATSALAYSRQTVAKVGHKVGQSSRDNHLLTTCY
jgi:hypothetical protein